MRLEDHLRSCSQLEQISEGGDDADESGSFEVPSKDDPYEAKIIWMRKTLDSVRVPWMNDSKKLTVNRQHLLQYSHEQLTKFTPYDMHKEFQILFEGEISHDAGGLTKEWVCSLTKVLLSVETELFVQSKTDNISYLINPEWRPDKLSLYHFTGLIFGKAFFESIPVPCHLNRIIFKQLIGEAVTLEDLRFSDLSLFSSLHYIADNDITGILFEKFSVGKAELKPNGSDVAVTNLNKQEYISLRVAYEAYAKVKAPLDAFLEGFYKVVSKELLVCLSFDELELALCGIPFIDVQDWEANTTYRGVYTYKHHVIKWFWEVVSSLSQEQLSNLLLFSTGTSRLPVEGFRAFRTLRGEAARFTIESLGLEFLYPRAHTCFNRLDLPLYKTKPDLESALSYVIENHSAGFGME
jgi:hypothetical protein